jgi:hypothetical protein
MVVYMHVLHKSDTLRVLFKQIPCSVSAGVPLRARHAHLLQICLLPGLRRYQMVRTYTRRQVTNTADMISRVESVMKRKASGHVSTSRISDAPCTTVLAAETSTITNGSASEFLSAPSSHNSCKKLTIVSVNSGNGQVRNHRLSVPTKQATAPAVLARPLRHSAAAPRPSTTVVLASMEDLRGTELVSVYDLSTFAEEPCSLQPMANIITTTSTTVV